MTSFINHVKLTAHARGIVFVAVKNTDCKAIVGKSRANLETSLGREATNKKKAMWRFRIAVWDQLDRLHRTHGVNQFCGNDAVSPDFRRSILLKNRTLYRPDAAIMLAFQLDEDGEEFNLVALAHYSKAQDINEFGPSTQTGPLGVRIRAAIAGDKQLELDLICSQGATRTTASLLLEFVFAKELARKSRGQRKYTSIITHAVHYYDERDRVHVPLAGILTRLGFAKAKMPPEPGRERGQPDIVRHVFILLSDPGGQTVEQKLEAGLPPLGPIQNMCPLAPKSGIAYCQ
jgi:hypothetical protein